MAASGRVAPRFVPTLTEVVRVAARPDKTGRSPLAAQRDVADIGLLVEWVQAEVDEALKRSLHDLIANALVEQVDVVSARLRQEIGPLVRQAVVDAVANDAASREAG